MSIHVKLANIQQELKAPKNQRNKFGNYSYRSCEDILEAVKPLLKKEGCLIVVSDGLTSIEGELFVEAKATLIDAEGTASVSVSSYAKHPQEKKGMDPMQITGATSSYARKYALNGLLLIDDNKDADATNTHGKKSAPAKNNKLPEDKLMIALEGLKDPEKQEATLARLNDFTLTPEQQEKVDKANAERIKIMADGRLYLGKLNLTELEALKEKAFQGKSLWLDVAIWVNETPNPTTQQHVNISHGKGDEKTYVGSAKLYEKSSDAGF